MKVLPINNNVRYLTHNNIQQQELKQNISVKQEPSTQSETVLARQNIAFHGLFNSSNPDISKKFQYGLEALDNNSILIVTSNEIDSNRALKEASDQIGIPVLNSYTLKVNPEDLKNEKELRSHFAIFKKENEFYVLGLGPFWQTTVKKPGEKFDSDKHSVSKGQVRKLNQGEAIETGELIWHDEKHKFIFEPPYKYNPNNARRYLQYRSAVGNTESIKDLNSKTIAGLTATKKQQNAGKTKFFNFSDIGGLDNVIAELRKFVLRPVKYPEVFENVRLNKGILLYGPPRCGKTLLGQALANEAGLGFWYKNANEFRSGVVGSSEQSVRNYFNELIKEPGILFIDEFDAIAKTRDGSSNARYDDTLVNQLLGSMSDLEKSDTLSFVIAATNRKELLDEAMISTGRFGLHLEVPMPNEEGLESIFEIHAKNKRFDNDVDIKELVKEMFSFEFNGSDVAETITNAYFLALERLGMNAKMDAGTFCANDLKLISIAREDLIKALESIAKQKIAR